MKSVLTRMTCGKANLEFITRLDLSSEYDENKEFTTGLPMLAERHTAIAKPAVILPQNGTAATQKLMRRKYLERVPKQLTNMDCVIGRLRNLRVLRVRSSFLLLPAESS